MIDVGDYDDIIIELLVSDRHQLTVPQHRLSTYSRRAFAVTGLMMFNALPDNL